MFWNLPNDESSQVEPLLDYREREADEARREKRIADYERYVFDSDILAKVIEEVLHPQDDESD